MACRACSARSVKARWCVRTPASSCQWSQSLAARLPRRRVEHLQRREEALAVALVQGADLVAHVLGRHLDAVGVRVGPVFRRDVGVHGEGVRPDLAQRELDGAVRGGRAVRGRAQALSVGGPRGGARARGDVRPQREDRRLPDLGEVRGRVEPVADGPPAPALVGVVDRHDVRRAADRAARVRVGRGAVVGAERVPRGRRREQQRSHHGQPRAAHLGLRARSVLKALYISSRCRSRCRVPRVLEVTGQRKKMVTRAHKP